MPLVDVVGSVMVPPVHTAGIALNAGVICGVTVTVSVVVVAHCPAAGVNVYVVVLVLSTAGDQVPVMPLVDVVGSVMVPPVHTAGIASNAGVICGVTVTVSVVVVAHCPAAGVQVFARRERLLCVGDRVPVIPLVDVPGSVMVDPV